MLNELFKEEMNGLFNAIPGGRITFLVSLIILNLFLIVLIAVYNDDQKTKEAGYKRYLKAKRNALKPYCITGEEVMQRKKGA